MGEASPTTAGRGDLVYLAQLLGQTAIERDQLRRDLAVANARIEAVEQLHERGSWQGKKGAARVLWMAAREPIAFVDEFCRHCRRIWPCPTVAALSVPVTGNNEHQGEQ